MVFDFGGGTLDLAVVEFIARTRVRVLSQACEWKCGGNDLDVALAEHLRREVVARFPPARALLDDECAQSAADQLTRARLGVRLRLAAERIKISLSSNRPKALSLPELFAGEEAWFDVEVPEEDIEIKPEEFEAVCGAVLDRAVRFVRATLAELPKKVAR